MIGRRGAGWIAAFALASAAPAAHAQDDIAAAALPLHLSVGLGLGTAHDVAGVRLAARAGTREIWLAAGASWLEARGGALGVRFLEITRQLTASVHLRLVREERRTFLAAVAALGWRWRGEHLVFDAGLGYGRNAAFYDGERAWHWEWGVVRAEGRAWLPEAQAALSWEF